MSTIETPATIVSREGDLIRIVSRGVVSTPETINVTLAAVDELTGDTPLPVLFDARNWPGGSQQGWATVIERMLGSFSMVAMVVPADAPSIAGAYPGVIDRMLIPFQVFTDENTALEFLQSTPPDD